MKTFLWSVLLLSLFTGRKAQSGDADKYTLLLTGASFASPHNGWFETGCRELGAVPLNRAVGGESIRSTASRMADGSLYSFEELDAIDALVIMQVHDMDVYDPARLLPSYTDYTLPFGVDDYAAAFDYVIKRYQSECYALKDDPRSRYYGTAAGKPAVVVLCTHWHDARETYNSSVRRLAARWGLPLVEFDRYIGFSKNAPHPVTGAQQSLLFATDTQTIDGTVYGWHPERGEDKYIQRRMAAIFAALMRTVLPLQ